MPQIPVIQTAAPKTSPQAKPSGSTGSKEQGRFSPHLKKAISGKKTEQPTDQDKIAKNQSAKTDNKPSAEVTEEIGKPQKTKKSAKDIDAAEADTAVDDSSQESPEQAITSPLYTESSPVEASEASIASDATQGRATNTPTTKAAVTNTPTANTATAATFSATNPEGKTATSLLEKADPGALTKPQAAKAQDILINQLQRIINSSSEKETVSIKRAENSFAAGSKTNEIPSMPLTSFSQAGTKAAAQAETNSVGKPFAPLLHESGSKSLSAEAKPAEGTAHPRMPESPVNGLFAAAGDDIDKIAGKPTDHLTGTRHGIQQQFVDAKIGRQNLAENQQNYQENRQEDKLSQNAVSSNPSSGLSGATDQTSTFSQVVTASQPITVPVTATTVPPITLPSGTVVHEDEIIRQMTEKFQVSGRPTDSRINIKLHPAELGELKIDLSVKEGSIRANVVAQSHHTMQILEKNIQKLRTVLENQGFTVDEIAVSAESDSVSGFDLFDRQFFSKDDQTPTTPQGRRTGSATFALEDNINVSWATNSGVNVKI